MTPIELLIFALVVGLIGGFVLGDEYGRTY